MHIVKKLKCSYTVNKIKLTIFEVYINLLTVKICISLQVKINFKKMTL